MSHALHDSPLTSRRMIHVGQVNHRTEKELERELNHLEKERQVRLRQLNQETNRFRVSSARSISPSRRAASPGRTNSSLSSSPNRTISRPVSSYTDHWDQTDNSPPKTSPSNTRRRSLTRSTSHGQQETSPTRLPALFPRGSNLSSRSNSPATYLSQSPKSRSPSPRQPYFKAVSIDNSEISAKISPKSSKETQKQLLPRRNTPEKTEGSISPPATVTCTTVTVIHLDEDDAPTRPRRGSVFEINDRSPPQKSPQPVLTPAFPRPVAAPIPQIVISSDQASPATSPRSESAENTSSSANGLVVDLAVEKNSSPVADTPSESLAIPVRRGRSCSVPSIIMPPTAYLKSMAKRESTFTTADDEEPPPLVVRTRQRSSSVCVPSSAQLLKSARRDSLVNPASQYMARRGSYRRTSVTIDHIISDLVRGIYHAELNPRDSREKPVSQEEWEKLKKCRYLRMPSQEENQKDNNINIGEIFTDYKDADTSTQ